MNLRRSIGRLLRALRLRPPLPGLPVPPPEEWPRLASLCKNDPGVPEPHRLLAWHFLARRQPLHAYACYRTARALGAPPDNALSRAFAAEGMLLPLSPTDAARASTAAPARAEIMLEFQRLSRIASRVRELAAGKAVNLVDVGGGTGALALLLPECNYFLAEPNVNGLAGADAMRYGRQFDIVTCCHVLEHIPETAKPAFLADLTALTTGSVILLGPSVDATPRPPVDELFLKITGQDWAAEHLACGWPRISDIRRFVDERGLQCSVNPNGDLAATYWMVFAYHYATLAGKYHELPEITELFNRAVCPDPLAPPPPNDFLVEIRCHRPGPA